MNLIKGNFFTLVGRSKYIVLLLIRHLANVYIDSQLQTCPKLLSSGCRKRRDAKKRRPEDANYDPRTLYLPPDFLKSLSGGQVITFR